MSKKQKSKKQKGKVKADLLLFHKNVLFYGRLQSIQQGCFLKQECNILLSSNFTF